MSVIDTAMLAAMRDAIAELLPETCNILTVTQVADGYGGITETWGTAYTSVPCRLDIKTRQEPINGESLRSFKGSMLSVPYDTTIEFNNRIELNDITYVVMSVNDNQSWMAVKRVTVEAL